VDPFCEDSRAIVRNLAQYTLPVADAWKPQIVAGALWRARMERESA